MRVRVRVSMLREMSGRGEINERGKCRDNSQIVVSPQVEAKGKEGSLSQQI